MKDQLVEELRKNNIFRKAEIEKNDFKICVKMNGQKNRFFDLWIYESRI